jgi:GDP-4-dehydro-6-deoxy-D-mannose reductase
MRVLITGAGGFVGWYLSAELIRYGYEVHVMDVNFKEPVPNVASHITMDILNTEQLNHLVGELKPEACVHLAGISSVSASHTNPSRVMLVNVIGTVNLLEAFRNLCKTSRILVISSSRIYGQPSDITLLSEDTLPSPQSIYAVSKLCADLASLTYAREYGMNIMVARPGNHTGPRQPPQFVVASICSQIKAIALGKAEPVIDVGNMESACDFSDVRDVVRAYRLLIEKGKSGLAYNISSGKIFKIRDIVETGLNLARLQNVRINVNPQKFRPTELIPPLDTSRIREHTGWQPEISFEQTIRDMLEHG